MSADPSGPEAGPKDPVGATEVYQFWANEAHARTQMQHKCGEMSLQVTGALGVVMAALLTAYFSHLDSKGSAAQTTNVAQTTNATATNAAQTAQTTYATQTTNTVQTASAVQTTKATQAANAAQRDSAGQKSLLSVDSPGVFICVLLFVHAFIQTLILANYVYHTFQINMLGIHMIQLFPRLAVSVYDGIEKMATKHGFPPSGKPSRRFRLGWRFVRYSQPLIVCASAGLGWLLFFLALVWHPTILRWWFLVILVILLVLAIPLFLLAWLHNKMARLALYECQQGVLTHKTEIAGQTGETRRCGLKSYLAGVVRALRGASRRSGQIDDWTI